jgi:hypothetical protein
MAAVCLRNRPFSIGTSLLLHRDFFIPYPVKQVMRLRLFLLALLVEWQLNTTSYQCCYPSYYSYLGTQSMLAL